MRDIYIFTILIIKCSYSVLVYYLFQTKSRIFNTNFDDKDISLLNNATTIEDYPTRH